MGEPKRTSAAAEKPVMSEDDPVWQAALHAPVVEATPEELAALEEGLVDIRAGRTVSTEEVRASIEERRRAEG
jgi:predicted transcriptional regulator